MFRKRVGLSDSIDDLPAAETQYQIGETLLSGILRSDLFGSDGSADPFFGLDPLDTHPGAGDADVAFLEDGDDMLDDAEDVDAFDGIRELDIAS